MSYIGVQSQNQISPQFSREVINGDGSATTFDLIQDVPGFNADNIMVVVNNVIQEPAAAYTIIEDGNGNPRRLDFGSGNVLSTTDECYVQHRGVGTLNMTPAAGSVNAAALQDNLRSGNVDQKVGSDATNGSTRTTYTMSETPLNANSISVFINGVYQRPSRNYTVSGTTITFTSSLLAADEIDIHHHTIRTTVTHVADGSVTSGKLDTNIQVAGTLGVTGASTLTGNTTVGGTLGVTGNVTASANLTVTGNLTVNGTQTTINTATLDVEDKNIEIAKVSSPSDTTAADAGITIKGATDKTLLWKSATNSLSSNVKLAENAGSSAFHRPLTTMLALG